MIDLLRIVSSTNIVLLAQLALVSFPVLRRAAPLGACWAYEEQIPSNVILHCHCTADQKRKLFVWASLG